MEKKDKRKSELEVVIGCNSKSIVKELKRITKDVEKLNASMGKLGRSIRALSDREIEITVGQYRKDISIFEFIKSKLKQ